MAKFRPLPDPLVELVRENGGCIVSRHVTVDGRPVGYMVRDTTDRPGDTGWSFFSGDEDQHFVDDAENFDIWHLNEIANYDPDIVPYLYALPGQTFDRDGRRFVEAPTSEPDAAGMQHPPGVQVVQGVYRLARGWSIELPTPFRQRVEDGNCVLWRPCLTFWCHHFESAGESIADRMKALQADASPNASDVYSRERDGLMQLTYRLREDTTDAKVPSVYALIVGARGHLQLGIYADREVDAAAAYEIVETIREV